MNRKVDVYFARGVFLLSGTTLKDFRVSSPDLPFVPQQEPALDLTETSAV